MPKLGLIAPKLLKNYVLDVLDSVLMVQGVPMCGKQRNISKITFFVLSKTTAAITVIVKDIYKKC